MRTFEKLTSRCQTISGDFTDATKSLFQNEINEGGRKLNAAMNRYFTRKSKKKNLVADRQYYQLPADCIRVISVATADSAAGRLRPLGRIANEDDWLAINYYEQTGNWQSHYFVRGNDEIGLYPIPASAITNGLQISYEPRDRELSVDDFDDGTITVANGDATVTHSGTDFTTAMAGRYLETEDRFRYKIASVTSNSILELEEPYMGASGSGKAVLIGEAFSFPEHFATATADYALGTFYEMRGKPDVSSYYMVKFKLAEKDAKEQYAMSSSSQIIGGDGMDIGNLWLTPPNALS